MSIDHGKGQRNRVNDVRYKNDWNLKKGRGA